MNIPKLRFKDNNGNDYPQWEKKLIKDILKIYHGKDYKNEPNEKKLYPVLGTGGIITYIDKFLCDWECVLIGRKGTINKPQYMKTPFWSVDTLFYSKPKLKQNPKFQYYLFQNINWKIYDESTGVPSLSASTIEHINRFIPTYAEQEKIASFFSTIDKKIENLANTITSLENQKKGLLQQILSQKLRFKDENGNNYPIWEKKKLNEISDVSSGKRIPKGMQFPSIGKTFYITVSDMSENFVSPLNINTISDDIENIIKKYKVFTGDIIISVAGTLGKINLITPLFNNANLTENCDRISNFKKVYNLYIFYFLKSNIIQETIKKSSTLSSQPKLALERIRNFNILLPCLEEQTKIADFLSAFDRKLDNQKAQLEHWQQIKKGLLQQMFV